MCGSLLASRSRGTATDPRDSLPPRRASIIARRRLSLAAPQIAFQQRMLLAVSVAIFLKSHSISEIYLILNSHDSYFEYSESVIFS